METQLHYKRQLGTSGLAVLTTVVHTHVLVYTLMELIGLLDVGEKSFVSTVWMDQGMSVLETMLEYTTQQHVGG